LEQRRWITPLRDQTERTIMIVDAHARGTDTIDSREQIMTTHEHLLPVYLRLRQAGLRLNHELVGTLSKEDLHEGARRLGMLHDETLVFDSPDKTSVLMDYCIHNFYSGGKNAAQRYLAESPPRDSVEMTFLQAMQTAYYSILRVTDVERGVGVAVRDVLRGGTGFVVDVGFGSSAQPGWSLAGRVIPLEDFLISGGASLPINAEAVIRIAKELKRIDPATDLCNLAPDQEADLAAMVIRSCLRSGASAQIRYETPGSTPSLGNRPSVRSQPVRANRNDPCPCGSGRKYKTCCGKRSAWPA